jgi:hypothetical protein
MARANKQEIIMRKAAMLTVSDRIRSCANDRLMTEERPVYRQHRSNGDREYTNALIEAIVRS